MKDPNQTKCCDRCLEIHQGYEKCNDVSCKCHQTSRCGHCEEPLCPECNYCENPKCVDGKYNKPYHTQQKGWTLEERVDLIWSRAEIPEYANDAKFVIKALISSLLTEQKKRVVGMVEAGKDKHEQECDQKGSCPWYRDAKSQNKTLTDLLTRVEKEV